MRFGTRFFLLVIVILALSCLVSAQAPFYLNNGDRVVFFGDSITDQRLYTVFVETYVVTRFPTLDVTFVHSGWGGDRVTGGAGGSLDRRLNRDVLTYKPTVVTVMLGMNDGRVRAFDEEVFGVYTAGMQDIVKKLRQALPRVRLTLIQPSPYDDVTRPPLFEGGYNAVLLRYAQFVKELSQKQGLDTADLNAPVVAALQTANAANPELARRIINDRVHPGPGGHLVMAAALLKAWNAPAVVSAVRIDAAARKAEEAENTRVLDLDAGQTVRWVQDDRSLPMPIDTRDPATALAVRSSDVIGSLNREFLSVRNLSAERYTLKIDGDEVGIFTNQQLAAGINLATLATPMSTQAKEVHELTVKHNNVHAARWRQIQVAFERTPSATLDKALEALDALDAELVRQQRAAAQPRTHRYELLPVAAQ